MLNMIKISSTNMMRQHQTKIVEEADPAGERMCIWKQSTSGTSLNQLNKQINFYVLVDRGNLLPLQLHGQADQALGQAVTKVHLHLLLVLEIP